MATTTIDFTFWDNSEAVIEELTELTQEALISSADMIVSLAKEKINKGTGELADGIVAQDKYEMKLEDDFSNASIELGYLTQMSFKMNVRRGTFYPNPYWLEFGTKPHTIETKELAREKANNDNSNEKFSGTYFLTDHKGQTYGYSASHPGITKHNYLRDAEEQKFPLVKDNMIKKIGEIETVELDAMKSKELHYTKKYF